MHKNSSVYVVRANIFLRTRKNVHANSQFFKPCSYKNANIVIKRHRKVLWKLHKLNNKLNCKSHLKNICKEAEEKLRAFSRILKWTANEKQWWIISLTRNFLTVLWYWCLLQRVAILLMVILNMVSSHFWNPPTLWALFPTWLESEGSQFKPH